MHYRPSMYFFDGYCTLLPTWIWMLSTYSSIIVSTLFPISESSPLYIQVNAGLCTYRQLPRRQHKPCASWAMQWPRSHKRGDAMWRTTWIRTFTLWWWRRALQGCCSFLNSCQPLCGLSHFVVVLDTCIICTYFCVCSYSIVKANFLTLQL